MGKQVKDRSRVRQCDICLETMRGNQWRRHLKQHAANKEDLMYRCSFDGCGYRSLQKPAVGYHYFAMHTDIRLYVCQQEVVDENGDRSACSYSTAHPSGLLRHLQKQHGVTSRSTIRTSAGTGGNNPAIPYYDAYVLPPVTQTIIVDSAVGNSVRQELTCKTAIFQSAPHEEHDKQHTQPSRNVLGSTQQSSSIAHPVHSATDAPICSMQVEGPNLLCATRRTQADARRAPSPRPTLAPLNELERIRRERYGEPTGHTQHSRLPESLRKILNPA
ncbi:hypothetical protein PYCCODRAFT_1439697 [Trametes coccinea BRFM310]|uniref:C2H2-type domain-containing protein n=1 Tax=Trametes coccinea (strain BRFM310) TaxID=1353009 RepID=A0A1Y2IC94_TRAC3|nr:hypothetical protein PYCCODRAFT_1439697 [Trametes coccinea BRFM310]